MLNIKKNIYLEEFLYTVMVLLVVFLMTLNYALIVFIMFFIIFSLLIIKNRTNIYIPKTILLFFLLIILLLIHMILEPSQYYSLSIAKKEFFRLIIFIILVLVIANLKIRETYFFVVWSVIFITLFIIGVFQYYNLFSMNDILGFVYGETIHLEVSRKYSDLSNFRAGSVFINFNNYSQFIIMMLSIFLFYKYKNKISNKLFSILFIIVLINLILTGSRTGFLVCIVLILITLLIYYYKKGLTLSKYIKINLVVLSIIIIFITFFSDMNINNFRLLDVKQGLSNSLDYKYTTFLNMIREMNILQFLIGFGPYDYLSDSIDQVDFDLGNMLTYYGLFGFIFYSLFIYFTFRKKNHYNVSYKLLLFYLLFVFVMTSLTSGMFFNLRIFSILLLLTSTNFIEKKTQ